MLMSSKKNAFSEAFKIFDMYLGTAVQPGWYRKLTVMVLKP